MIASMTDQGKEERHLDKKQFCRDFGAWGYTLLISLLPFFIVFILYTGPLTNFDFFELFKDNALYYVCVTMSALSLYTYKTMNWVRVVHIFILITGMAIYVSVASGHPVPLFIMYDHRKIIFVFLLISILVGFFTLLYSSIKRGD
jgi:hypothetical protein